MNEIKRSLIEIAGDLSESKERVRRGIYEKQNRKKNLKRDIWTGISAFAMIAGIFIVISLLMTGQQKVTQATLFNDQTFDTALKINKVIGFESSDEARLEFVYENYERDLAMYTYALSLGYEITEEEINETFQQQMDLMFGNDKVKIQWQDILTKANISMNEYEEYLYQNSPYDVALQKLKEHYMGLYPMIPSEIASSMANKHAIPYFREHFADEIKVFKEKHGLSLYESPIWEGSKTLGRVVAFEENMFLVVPKTTIEDIKTLQPNEILSKYLEGYWYPQDENIELNEGDLVETYSKTRESTRSPFVSDLWGVKMIDDYDSDLIGTNTVQLTIEKKNFSRVKSFIGMLTWDETEIQFTSPPHYQFVLNDIIYQIWSYPDGFVLYSSKGEYRKLSEDFTQELSGYLDLVQK